MRAIHLVGDPTVDPSREAAAEGASLRQVYFQKQRSLVPAEWNLIGTVAAERDSLVLAGVGRPGFAKRGTLTNPSGFVLHLPRDFAIAGGEVVEIDDGTLGGASVTLDAPPTSGTRDDAVYLEVYHVEVAALGTPDATSKALPTRGGAGGTDLASDAAYALKDPEVPSPETTRRIQVRWRLRVTPGIDAVAHPRGVGDPLCTGQGAAGAPVGGATFVHPDDDLGHYRAGTGTLGDAAAFGTVAGYTWAIPVAVCHREAGETAITTIADARRGSSVGEAVAVATADVQHILNQGTYNVGQIEQNTWKQIVNGGIGPGGGVGPWNLAGVTTADAVTCFFPLFPSKYLLAPGYKLRAQVYGLSLAPPEGGGGTYGLRLRAPGRPFGESSTQAQWTLGAGAIQRLEAIMPPFDLALDGSQDGLWIVEGFTSVAGANAFNTTGVWLKIAVVTA